MVCLCKSICIYFQETVESLCFCKLLAISHFSKQCLFSQQLKILDCNSSNNSIQYAWSVFSHTMSTLSKIYRLMFFQAPVNIIQQYMPQLVLAIVAAFQSSQTLWNKSSASIFVFYLIACYAAIWRYEINVQTFYYYISYFGFQVSK